MSSLAEIREMSGTELRYALMDLAKEVPDAIALGRGDPDLDTPAEIVSAVKKALRTGRNRLMPAAGMPELREAIAAKAVPDHNLHVSSDQVMVTAGGQEGLFLIISALIDPGDEILVPDPRYTSYDQAIEYAGGVAVSVPTYPEDAFDVRPEEVEKRIGPKTKALLLVTPSNPTGGIVTRKNAEALAELAVKHNFVVISDEIYGKFVYPPFEHVSIGSMPGMSDRTITLSGFSKAYAMTGFRVGYIIAPEDAIEAMTSIKTVTTGPVATVSQEAALAAATGSEACIDEFREIYLGRRSLLAEGLSAMGFRYGEPRGGFFFWTDSSSTGMRALELSYLFLKEARVLIFPGTAFGDRWSDYLRITMLQPDEVLKEALARMSPVVARYRGSSRG
ncbi:MAG: aminotransferase class I/II-fold pyridoxal phosphate-dependent enzyme [Trueperaceae bacterium]|nr:MAG: aminotransferase class I/II-fold pyridoxal phosphate-dependent enzyme [Trueperaceae bacterium]